MKFRIPNFPDFRDFQDFIDFSSWEFLVDFSYKNNSSHIQLARAGANKDPAHTHHYKRAKLAFRLGGTVPRFDMHNHALPTTTVFPNPDELNLVGLIINMLVCKFYFTFRRSWHVLKCPSLMTDGWILLTSADYIGDSAEEMLDILPDYGKIIGALLVPILGAIPDGMMILLSGMGNGTKMEIQDQLNVGVGTLAGSTIMLLVRIFPAE